MRPSGLRQRAVVTYLTDTEAGIVDAARLLDGGDSAQARSTWMVARAVERLEAHAAAGSRLAAGALAELCLSRRLMGAPRDGRKPAHTRVFVAGGLAALADLAARQGDADAEAEARTALAALRAPAITGRTDGTMRTAEPRQSSTSVPAPSRDTPARMHPPSAASRPNRAPTPHSAMALSEASPAGNRPHPTRSAVQPPAKATAPMHSTMAPPPSGTPSSGSQAGGRAPTRTGTPQLEPHPVGPQAGYATTR